ncbi:Carboxylesterase 5A [Bulinus truncatus]|nr:Carboxylesterase 5A [Bulinus truncatus]
MEEKTELSTVSPPTNRQPHGRKLTMGWKIFGIVMSFILVAVAVALSSLAWAGHSGRTEAAVLPPTISTPVGLRYVGAAATSVFNGKSYVTYKSIPFAKPPIGPLRFKRPQSLDPPSGNQYQNSESFKPSCWTVTKQSTDPMYSEDCLYLNVYVPGDAPGADPQRSYPVMVWIHGGGFVAGTTFPEPVKMVTRGDVIVVTVNYRMGAFGFLTTLDGDLPANNGLWDVEMALQWVQDNIRYFSGNDSSVTVFGESAGAVSAALLAFSPVSGKHFHKVILQSGSATTTILSRDAPQRAREFAAAVGCSPQGAPSSQLAQCLRNASVDNILKNSKPSSFSLTAGRRQADFVWVPTVDGELIPGEPAASLSNLTYLKNVGALEKDYIIGVLNNEGGLISENFLGQVPLSAVGTPNFPSEILDHLFFSRYNVTISQKIRDAVFQFYDIVPNNFTRPQNVLNFSGDLLFEVPAVETALALSRCSGVSPWTQVNASAAVPGCSRYNPRIYVYHFDYCPPINNLNKPQCLVHGVDVGYEMPKVNLSDPIQNQLSDTFIDLLTSFAHDSTPGSAVASGWPTFDQFTQMYLRLDTTPSVRTGPFNTRVNFWLNTVPALLKSNA